MWHQCLFKVVDYSLDGGNFSISMLACLSDMKEFCLFLSIVTESWQRGIHISTGIWVRSGGKKIDFCNVLQASRKGEQQKLTTYKCCNQLEMKM